MFEFRKLKKLEKERQRVLDNISYERWQFEMMAQRAQAAGEQPSREIVNAALARFSEFEQQARNTKNIDEFDELIEKAEEQGTLRAYICPIQEVLNEGSLAIDVMVEWSIPKIFGDFAHSLSSDSKNLGIIPANSGGNHHNGRTCSYNSAHG